MTFEATDIAKWIGTGIGSVAIAIFAQRKRIPESPLDRPQKLTLDTAHYRLGLLEKQVEKLRQAQDDRHEENSRRLRLILKKLRRSERAAAQK